MDVRGTVAAGWEPVRDAFLRNFEERGERGAAVAVHRDGEKVVDLWAGTKDADGTGPWTEDTAQVVRSATKGVSAAVPLLLHQRGLLDLDAPVSSYWPEFKAHGKDRVTVRQLLAHRAGVPVLDAPLTLAEAVDLDTATRAIAAQAPAWEPGAAHGYHAHTFSWLLSGLVHRVTGRTLGRWAAEEITGPSASTCGSACPTPRPTASAGSAPSRRSTRRAAAPSSSAPSARSPRRTRTRSRSPGAPSASSSPPRRERPRLPGGRTARLGGRLHRPLLSRFYAATLGPVDGADRLFAPATLALARTEESAGPDRVLLVGTRFGLGHMLHGPASRSSALLLRPPRPRWLLGFADPDTGIAFGYVTNGMRKTVTADPRAQALVRAVRSVTG
ncbi:serine hydrolase [Streptomyces diastatochromogenes]|nr:serine hydrolase [Streptomyces diastatochromogenes]